MSTDRTRMHDDLLEAFGREGCPLCRVALEAVSAYLASISHEGGVTDLEIRDRIRASHGFCRAHAYRWLEEQHVLGTAIIYEDVLGHVAEELRRLRFGKRGLLAGMPFLAGGRGGGGVEALAPHRSCLACVFLAEYESAAVQALLRGLERADFREAYGASAGLCLPHLGAALAAAPDEGALGALIEAALDRHEALRGELREIMRKHDYRFRGEPVGDERGAERRAVRHVAGERGLPGPDAPRRDPR